MIKDPENNRFDSENISFLENMDSLAPSSIFSIESPEGMNNLVNSEVTDLTDGDITDMGDGNLYAEKIASVLFACDNIPKGFVKDNVTVASSRHIPGVKTTTDDIRYTKRIDQFDKVILNKEYSDIRDYERLIENFERRAKNKSELIMASSDKNIYIRKIAQELGLDFKENPDFVTVKREEDKFSYCSIGGNLLKCMKCEDSESKERGLQEIDSLEEDEGMIFSYSNAGPRVFAMKDVSFPIDIIFIDGFQVSSIHRNVQPGDKGFYEGYADTVVEVNGGWCDENEVTEGSEYLSVVPEDREIFKSSSSYDAYFLSDLISKESSYCRISNPAMNLFGAEAFSQKVNSVPGRKFFIAKKASYFEPIKNNFILVNDTELSNLNAKRMFLSAFPDFSYKIVKAHSRSPKDLSNIIMSSFNCHEVNLFDLSITKEAAFPVPNSVRETAFRVDKAILKNIKRIKKLESDLEKNRTIYSKNKDNYEAIKGSKGVYRQSMKRMSVSFKAILLAVKSIVQALESIKDTTQVEEINGSVLSTTQNLSKFFKEILDMQEKTDSMEFFQDLDTKTNEFSKISEDLKTVHKRVRDFIWTHIIGSPLLTD